MYDENRDWDHGLELDNLTEADLKMDAEEEAEVTGIRHLQLATSVADTFGVAPLQTVPFPPIAMFYDIICSQCQHTSSLIEPTNNWNRPDMPTIDNIRWYCSSYSVSERWFKVAVGRRIGIFDNWCVFYVVYLYISYTLY